VEYAKLDSLAMLVIQILYVLMSIPRLTRAVVVMVKQVVQKMLIVLYSSHVTYLVDYAFFPPRLVLMIVLIKEYVAASISILVLM
jgi:hypothetical protein